MPVEGREPCSWDTAGNVPPSSKEHIRELERKIKKTRLDLVYSWLTRSCQGREPDPDVEETLSALLLQPLLWGYTFVKGNALVVCLHIGRSCIYCKSKWYPGIFEWVSDSRCIQGNPLPQKGSHLTQPVTRSYGGPFHVCSAILIKKPLLLKEETQRFPSVIVFL